MRTFILSGVLLALCGNEALAQTGGCTDPVATNYSAEATFNNGTCVYNTSTISVNKVANLPAVFKEISGMVYYNDKLYGHQDSGGTTAIYEFDENTGAVTRTITLQGVTNVDWEDITQDETHFYIGDVGNNTTGNRIDLKIYKFPKSLISTTTGDISIPSSEIQTINFSYEDQTDFTPKSANQTKFDCEAIAYNRGTLHLFTKNWIENTSTHYTLPIIPGTYKATKRDTFSTGGVRITGADFGAYDSLILVGYETSGVATIAMFLNYGFDGTYYYLNTGNKRRLNIGSVASYGQVEGVAMKNALEGFISNEYFIRKVLMITIEVPHSLYTFNIFDYIKEYYKKNPIDLNKLSNPEVGTIRYNKNTHKIEGFDGTHWNPFGVF